MDIENFAKQLKIKLLANPTKSVALEIKNELAKVTYQNGAHLSSEDLFYIEKYFKSDNRRGTIALLETDNSSFLELVNEIFKK